MTARVLLLALLQVGAVALVGRAVVAACAPVLDREREWLGSAERWLLSLPGVVAFAVMLMIGHMATRGRVFDRVWVVPAAAVLLVGATLWRRRPRIARLDTRTALVVSLLAIALVALYALPAIRGGSSLRTGDNPWHLGWTNQVLGGDPLPTGPAPATFARNAYPWGHHALLATMVRLVPGSDPLIAHEGLHLLLIGAIPLAAACLARIVNRRAGIAAAAAAASIGGFGWIAAGRADFIASPLEARYGADLVVASPNAVYQLLPPALPRESGLVLLAAAALLLAAMVRRPSRARAVVTGMVVGLVGLVSVPMFLSALVWGFALAITTRRSGALPAFAIAGSTALVVFGIWAAPVIVDYMRFDGFTAVAPTLGVEWELDDGVAAWGLLAPLALAGVGIVIAQPSVVGRALLVYGGCAVGLLALTWVRAEIGWDVFANETLFHRGRYWPTLHLVGAAFAGIALTVGYGWLRARSRVLGLSAVALVLGIGAISPVYASMDLTRTIKERKKGFLYGDPELQDGSFVRTAAAAMDPDDLIRVEGSDVLAFYLWQFSGARITAADGRRLGPNPHRIRYGNLAQRWHRAESNGAFDPDWVVTAHAEPSDNSTRATGMFRGETWQVRSLP